MRFVTEDELRQAHAQSHLECVELDSTTRLTPGARQFLIDFHIPIIDKSQTQKSSKASFVAARSKATPTDDDFYALSSVAGAALRLSAKHADGICNAMARELESYGLKWLRADFAKTETEMPRPLPVAYPPLTDGMHEFYLELSLLDARLNELSLALAAYKDLAQAKGLALDIYELRTHIAATLNKKLEELSHE